MPATHAQHPSFSAPHPRCLEKATVRNRYTIVAQGFTCKLCQKKMEPKENTSVQHVPIEKSSPPIIEVPKVRVRVTQVQRYLGGDPFNGVPTTPIEREVVLFRGSEKAFDIWSKSCGVPADATVVRSDRPFGPPMRAAFWPKEDHYLSRGAREAISLAAQV